MFDFEELDFQSTPLGDISLRRRAEPRLGGEIVYEVKLGDEFLMSSLFPEAEIQLARLGLEALVESGMDTGLDVVVGGLGLGYTAAAVLEVPAVASLTVIDVMAPVIDWHRRGLVPLGATLCDDARCTLLQGDFFALAASDAAGFGAGDAAAPVHAVLLDIDHSPRHWLHPDNRGFYSIGGLQALANKLHAGGVFGLWSNEPPDNDFIALLGEVFVDCRSHVVRFANPYTGGRSSNTVYLAHRA